MSSIAARRAHKRACPLPPNGILSRGTYGILAQMPSHTMPPRGVSCHLLQESEPSLFQNLRQKGGWEEDVQKRGDL